LKREKEIFVGGRYEIYIVKLRVSILKRENQKVRKNFNGSRALFSAQWSSNPSTWLEGYEKAREHRPSNTQKRVSLSEKLMISRGFLERGKGARKRPIGGGGFFFCGGGLFCFVWGGLNQHSAISREVCPRRQRLLPRQETDERAARKSPQGAARRGGSGAQSVPLKQGKGKLIALLEVTARKGPRRRAL